jgi:hypothetical protein
MPAYIPNADDVTQPTEDKPLLFAAEELRDLKVKIETVDARIDSFEADVAETEANKDIAVAAAVAATTAAADITTNWSDKLAAANASADVASTSAANADASADSAEAAKLVAEAARDAAAVNANVYADVAAGLAAVADGVQFQVVSSDGESIHRYRRDPGPVAVLVASYPSAQGLAYQVSVALDVASASPVLPGEFHDGGSGVSAVIQGDDGTVLLAWDSAGKLIGYAQDDGSGGDPVAGLDAAVDLASRPAVMPAEFHGGSDELSAAVVDQSGKTLLAWDAVGTLLNIDPPGVGGTAMLAYAAGGELRTVGAADESSAPLGVYQVLATAPGNGSHARAVVDWPALGPSRSVAVAPNLGLMIPDDRRVLHVVIGLGQSLMVGSQAASSLVSIVPVWPDDALMFTRSDGLSDVRMGLPTADVATSIALDPSLLVDFEALVSRVGQGGGSRGETPMESFSASLAAQARLIGAQFRTLSFAAATGGAAYDSIKKGTLTYNNMLTALTRAKQLAEAKGWRVIVDGCMVKHGEANSSTVAYLANLLEWQSDIDADVKAITGQLADVHFVMNQPSTHTTATPRAIQAMLDAHNTSPYHHLAGADYPFGSAYAADELHMTGPGYYWIGEQMARAWRQALWSSAGKSKIVQIISASRTGTSVVMNYEVPVPPLVFDTTTLTERDVRGFRFFDSSGQVSISSAAITGPAQITLTLGSTPSGSGERIEYATAPQADPKTAASRPRGNVRDSSNDTSAHTGRALHNWAVHQSFAL